MIQWNLTTLYTSMRKCSRWGHSNSSLPFRNSNNGRPLVREEFAPCPSVFPPEWALGGGDGGERALVAQSSWSRVQKGRRKAVSWCRGAPGEGPTFRTSSGHWRRAAASGPRAESEAEASHDGASERGSRALPRDGSSGSSRAVDGALPEKWGWPGLPLCSDIRSQTQGRPALLGAAASC